MKEYRWMSYEYSEDGLVEKASQEVLEQLGWDVKTAWHNESFSVKDDRSDGLLGRASKSEIILQRYLNKHWLNLILVYQIRLIRRLST